MVRRVEAIPSPGSGPGPVKTPQTPQTVPSRGEAAIEAWLDLMTRMLRLGRDDRESIRLELAEHLHERVRDLMIGGAGEDEAVRAAIGELGEAAEIAERFRVANRFRTRRILMHLSLIAVGAGVLGLGMVAVNSVTPAGAVRNNAYETRPAQGDLDKLLDTRADFRFQDSSIDETLEMISAQIDRTIHVHWRLLEQEGVDRENVRVNMNVRQLSVRRVMDLVLEAISEDVEELAWHVDDELIELGLRGQFDRRERTLVSYDVGAILLAMEEDYAIDYDTAIQQVSDLLLELVSPDHWMAAGGDVAQLEIVGGKMFVYAPRRMHRQVAWILGELAAGSPVPSSN